ncbi:hypothetical protein CIK06_14240 [Plantactinospora sp. KBS50]|nr:hypothetical protein CIK06_14240 [Plantactinospora sp. KBS50]
MASWIDDYGQSGDRDEVAGIENFEGTRAEVLAWARTRPAARSVIPGGTGWMPLPDDDNDDDKLRGDA